MAALKDYRIAFKGLRNGLTSLSFEIDESFFLHFEMSKIQEGKFTVEVQVEKQVNMIVLEFDISGYYRAACDRCTAPINVDMSGSERIVVKYSEEDQADTDEVMYIDPNSTHIELGDILYELIHVNMPILASRDCEADDYKYCDQAVLDVLEGTDDEDDDEDSNPLWEDLKNIQL
jgi:uncharacterized metal-binding protein YceD (DUF177 family)